MSILKEVAVVVWSSKNSDQDKDQGINKNMCIFVKRWFFSLINKYDWTVESSFLGLALSFITLEHSYP